jgi:hypothetical protein
MHEKNLVDIHTLGETGDGASNNLRVTDNMDGAGRMRKGVKKQEAEELDFEEDFQDDDGMLELGIEDEDDRKEAVTRAYGGAGTKSKIDFEDVDDEFDKQKKSSKDEKKMKKSLVKREGVDTLASDDEDDPYGSDSVCENILIIV